MTVTHGDLADTLKALAAQLDAQAACCEVLVTKLDALLAEAEALKRMMTGLGQQLHRGVKVRIW